MPAKSNILRSKLFENVLDCENPILASQLAVDCSLGATYAVSAPTTAIAPTVAK